MIARRDTMDALEDTPTDRTREEAVVHDLSDRDLWYAYTTLSDTRVMHAPDWVLVLQTELLRRGLIRLS